MDDSDRPTFRANTIEQVVLEKLPAFRSEDRNKRAIRTEIGHRTKTAAVQTDRTESQLAEIRSHIDRTTENLALADRRDIPSITRLLASWRERESELNVQLPRAHGERPPPPDIHSREEESFFILEGEITFQVNGQQLVAKPGMFANMPVGCSHSFKNDSGKPAKMLISVAPAGRDQMFFEVGQPAESGAASASLPTKAEIEKLLTVALRYGIDIKVPHHDGRQAGKLPECSPGQKALVMQSMNSILAVLIGCLFVLPQDTPNVNKATQVELRGIAVDLAAAQIAEDEAEVKRLATKAIEVLGDQAGLPEIADKFRDVPKNAKPLTASELPTAFDPYIDFIEKKEWWKVGIDPTKTNHLPRELATIIEGCLAARSVNQANAERLLRIANDAGDFLVWSQEQAGTGVIPFPAVRNGKGRPFEVAERFMQQAEKEGKLDQVVRNGWAIEDFSDGGLQFDNGLAGVALVQLFEATNDLKYKKAAIRAADWAMTRPVVTNWNYNSFSVYVLAEVYRITGDTKYLESARKKTRLGLLPGQLTEGPRKGRWADAHNARPPYHYIIVRGLAALAAVMPKDDADLPAVVESLRLALSARNPTSRRVSSMRIPRLKP